MPYQNKSNMKKILILIFLSPVHLYAQDTQDTTRVYEVAKPMPAFNGDIPTYIRDHFVYPAQAMSKGIQGTVVITYTVEKDGSVSGAYAIQSLDPYIDSSAIACVSSMKWTPGRLNGVPVRVKGAIPIRVTAPIIDSSSVNPSTPPRIK